MWEPGRLSTEGWIIMKVLGFFVAIAALMFTLPADAASVTAKISLSNQRMYVSVNGVPKYTWAVSTARSGYRTPTGTFRPQRLARMRLLEQVRQCADAAFGLLLRRLRDPRHQRRRQPRARPSRTAASASPPAMRRRSTRSSANTGWAIPASSSPARRSTRDNLHGWHEDQDPCGSGGGNRRLWCLTPHRR